MENSKLSVSSKKAQMKIQEMSFMVIALAIFFILMLLFYLAISLGGLKTTVELGTREKGVLLISALAGSPEFSCPTNSIDLCIDSDKLMALANRPAFLTFWDVEGLRIEKVYPSSSKDIICSEGNYPNCNIFMIVKSKSASVIEDASFASICRRESKNGYSYNKCELGKIIVTSVKTS